MNTNREEPQTISLQRIKALAAVLDEQEYGNDIIIGEASGEQVEQSQAILRMLQYPVRFDGYIIFYLKKGHFAVDVNLHTYEVREHSLMINVPGNIVKVSRYDEEHIDQLDLVFVLISKEFMSDIQLDFGKVFQDGLNLLHNPCIILDDFQMAVANDYLNLARKLIGAPLSYKREIIGSLLTSLTYLAADVWSKQVDEARKLALNPGATRSNQILEHFLALVSEHHNEERGVAFYADKLCLTPKYLSKLVKTASGRSAPDWIDAFVILEAKNLLKYSDLPIKEVVYRLHFPNPSVFHKFFKAHTGLTPMQYRNG
ncbi:MAG: helix-turn-helix domain-containing protein [Bacteroidales bacterium]|nr:helix-turn-helix domain-containing protein [Bacteroidales bacterium]